MTTSADEHGAGRRVPRPGDVPRRREGMLRPLDEVPRPVRAVIVGAGVVVAVAYLLHLAQTGLSIGGPGLDGLAAGWGMNALLIAAALAAGSRAVLVRHERLAWSFLASALGIWAIGEVYWYEVVLPQDPAPYPSLADACWLLFFPLCYTGLVLLVRSRVSRFPRSLWFDGVIGALGVATLSAAFVLRPILESTTTTTAATLTNLAYPVGDLTLLAIILWAVALTGWRPSPGWTALAAGIVIACVADSIFLVRVAEGTYTPATALDSLWPAGMLLLGAAAWLPGARRVPVRISGWLTTLVPSAFALAALAVQSIGDYGDIGVIAETLATATLVTALVRGALSLREARVLTESSRLALTDELTDLPNRRAFRAATDDALSAAGRDGGAIAVLLMDLDRFKDVNDTLGHQAGDDLLRVVAARLRNAVGDEAMVGRLGGDEFVVLASVREPSDALALGERLRRALAERAVIEGLTVTVETSVGIALFPHHGAETEELLRCADVAMYAAKADRTGVCLYTTDGDVHTPERLGLLSDLGLALARHELVLHFQPKMHLAEGHLVGAEVLVRWQHPTRGLLPPDDFIPLAEQSSLVRPLTLHVLDRAVAQCRRWLDESGLEVQIAVNVSARNLLDPNLPDDVAHILRRWRISPAQLELEITETAIMAHPGLCLEVLGRLHDLGVSLAIDDFGVGYSSLNYLKQLPVDVIKIDRSFVQDLAGNTHDQAIVRSTVDLAHALGLHVVAEGVESVEIYDRLAAMGCHSAQGYYLSRPVAADAFARWAAERDLTLAAAVPVVGPAPALLPPAMATR